MGSNEFIKLGMHEAASEAVSERGSEALRPIPGKWKERPLLRRGADTAPLIAWSCLGDAQPSQAATWGERSQGLL